MSHNRRPTTHKGERQPARGQVLPIVLFFLILLSAVGIFLVGTGSSEYRQTARAIARERAEQMARSAMEEAMLVVHDAVAPRKEGGGGSGPGLVPPPPWKDELLAKLESAVKRSAGSFNPNDYEDVVVELVLTDQMASSSEALQDARDGALVDARAKFYAFSPIVYPNAEVFATREAFYGEKLFGDAEKDAVPRDFHGYLTTTVKVKAGFAGVDMARTLEITRDVKVLDVTPPAREFSLFSYSPPPDEDYMLNDLNRGGILASYPMGVARSFVRGPLFLKVEDDDDDPSYGGTLRTQPSVTYPEGTTDWHGWAFVPGARAIRMPNFASTFSDILGIAGRLISGQGLGAFAKPPRRPIHEAPWLAQAKIPLLNIPLPGVWLLGIAPRLAIGALGGYVGVYQPIPPSEEIAVASNWAYLTGTVGRGKQTFSLAGMPADRTTLDASFPTQQPYSGVILKSDGTPAAEPFRGGVDLPRIAYEGEAGAVEDQDVILPEPLHYDDPATPESELEQAANDHGIYGLYRIATYNRYVYFIFDLGTFLMAVPGLNVVLGPVVAGLGMAGMQLALVPAHYRVKGPDLLDDKGLDELTEEDWEHYFFAPYGLHYDLGQNVGIWGELATDVAIGAFSLITMKIFDKAIVGKLFKSQSGGTAITKSSAAGDKLAVRVSRHFTGVARNRAKTHAMLRYMTRRFGQHTYQTGGTRPVQAVMVQRLMGKTLRGAAMGGIYNGASQVLSTVGNSAMRSGLMEGTESPDMETVTLAELRRDFPKGYFPPKYRPYFRAATRFYWDVEELLQHNPDGLRLNDVILVGDLTYEGHGQPIPYRGRGILTSIGREGERPVFDARLFPEDDKSYLTLAYENLHHEATASGGEGQLALAEEFAGSVYSTSGVRPVRSQTRIFGNLTSRLLNKQRIPQDASVEVLYDTKHLPPETDRRGQKDWWVVSVSPRIAAYNQY